MGVHIEIGKLAGIGNLAAVAGQVHSWKAAREGRPVPEDTGVVGRYLAERTPEEAGEEVEDLIGNNPGEEEGMVGDTGPAGHTMVLEVHTNSEGGAPGGGPGGGGPGPYCPYGDVVGAA